MERKEAFEFLSKEVRRLIEEEHVNDLFKACCAEELAAVECRTTKAFFDFLYNEDIILEDEEIEDGDCVAIALWGASSYVYNDQLVADIEKYAHRLAKEGGVYGKNIAFQMLEGTEICDIPTKDFFSDEYAEDYDKKYGVNAE